MLQIKAFNKTYQYPEKWHELTLNQFLKLVPLVFEDKESPKVQLKALRIIWPECRKLLKKFTEDEISQLIILNAWVWKEQMLYTPMKYFKIGDQLYFIPECENICALEWAFADYYYKLFAETGKEDYLHQLIATLCRPLRADYDEDSPDFDGDMRQKYNGKLAEKRATLMKALPTSIMIIVLCRYTAIKQFIHTNYPEAFQRPKGSQGAKTDKNSPIPGLDLVYSLADGGVFGDFEKVAHTNIHTIMLYLCKNSRDMAALTD